MVYIIIKKIIKYSFCRYVRKPFDQVYGLLFNTIPASLYIILKTQLNQINFTLFNFINNFVKQQNVNALKWVIVRSGTRHLS